MSVRRLLLIVALGLASVAGSLLPGAALAASKNDTARGKYTAPTGLGVVSVDFSAQSRPVGTESKGRAQWRLAENGAVVTGEVTCLRVVATSDITPAIAAIGGRVTKLQGGTNLFCPTCQGFLLFVSDGGQGASAEDTEFFQFVPTVPPQDTCPALSVPVTNGEIVIDNALP